ncbi:MAG TPA: DALR anticodon-binding domain-containing protein, partial [Chroococcales cyanobacterium]
SDLHEFLIQRLRTKLYELITNRAVVDSILGVRDPLTNLPDLLVRATALGNLMSSAGGLDLIRAGLRVGNIVAADAKPEVNEALFTEDAERELWDKFTAFKVHQNLIPRTEQEYDQLLNSLKSLTGVIDTFFDKVMVNDPDTAKKNNRHGLLKSIDQYFKAVADFPKLSPLLV